MRSPQLPRLKGKFLEHYGQFGNITTAARLTGIDRKTVYNWQEQDDNFAVAFREADITATEMLEAEARRRAVEGVQQIKPIYYQGFLVGQTIVTEYSDGLLTLLLKARAPERYRERHDITSAGNGLDFSFTIQRPEQIAAETENAAAMPSLGIEDDG